MKHFLHSFTTITRSQFEQLAQAFVRVSSTQMRSSGWLTSATPRRERLLKGDPTLFQLVGEREISSLFVPFVQKKVVSGSTAKVVIIGDLHGDYQTLTAVITELRQQNYIDDAWTLRPDITIVCLGDYSNRGRSSVPVMAALMHLFIHNPENVILLRGNHEYALTNKLFNKRHMSKKGTEEEYLGEVSLLEELQQRFEGYTYPDLLYWYDYLPQALFLGWDDEQSGKRQFVQLCHGGIEIGYNPGQLLHTSDDVAYEEFVRFDRGGTLRTLIDDKVLGQEVAQRMHDVLDYIKTTSSNGFESLYADHTVIDFKELQSSYHLRFGLQWNNFLSQRNDAILFAASAKRKNLIFGSLLTKYFMQQASSDNVTLFSIIRAHQHLNETIQELGLRITMLDDTCIGKGMVRQWGGLVYTLGASSEISGVQSFIMLDCAGHTVCHYYKQPEQTTFSSTQYRLHTEL
ncbi:MAG: metallophosphoesterase [Candidatus Babeliales bacterium]